MIFNYIMQQRCAGGVFVIHLSRQVKRMEHIRISAFILILFVGIIHDHARLFHKFRIIHEKPLLSILYYAPANSN